MKVGMIGLGKLGLPCATAIAMRGHDVMGYDLDEARMSKKPQPYQEAGPDGTGDFNDYLARAERLSFGTCKDVVQWADIVFVSVQTPHEPEYEGITRIPETRKDFDYRHLRAAVAEIAHYANRDTPLVIISTVLPGTMRREIEPILKSTEGLRHLKLCYNPFFIAMGTTMRDFLNPEFVLFGVNDEWAAERAEEFYESLGLGYEDVVLGRQDVVKRRPPFYRTTVENAELIKVAYNTYIGGKLAFVNTLMELCHHLPNTNVDAVTDALKLATTRLISPAYMTGGMGDGGGCHPRDNIALSWLAREHNLSYDWFDHVMMQREKQTEWLAQLIIGISDDRDLLPVILGYAFKPETNLTVGSPALLLKNVIRDMESDVAMYDKDVSGHPEQWDRPCVFFIGCRHARYEKDVKFPPGSVVIDPWRYVQPQPDVEIIPLGVGPLTHGAGGP